MNVNWRSIAYGAGTVYEGVGAVYEATHGAGLNLPAALDGAIPVAMFVIAAVFTTMHKLGFDVPPETDPLPAPRLVLPN